MAAQTVQGSQIGPCGLDSCAFWDHGGVAEGERFFLRPSKPVDEMTDEELDAFADALATRIHGIKAQEERDGDAPGA
ncbi:hypothetical protein GCM10027090_22490 [Sinomonas soli]